MADPATIDPRFLLDEARGDAIEAVIAHTWPERIELAEIGSQDLARTVRAARSALLDCLDLGELA